MAITKSPNAEFIAHSREDIPALLDEVEQLRFENAQLKEQLSESQRRERAAVMVIRRMKNV